MQKEQSKIIADWLQLSKKFWIIEFFDKVDTIKGNSQFIWIANLLWDIIMARTVELCLIILMVPCLIESYQVKDNNGSSSKNKMIRNDLTKEATCICLEEKCGKISLYF